eukprot:TRINITY_DN284_c0_g1_i4.p1 TRINITY_DN284_c0_g1~~TRINITY_DN284_c0_g1_i4.p1  ORF type:complete len:467 (+),score=41.02 TRINITY_DN284_c0_g1_i4:43-1401(+)
MPIPALVLALLAVGLASTARGDVSLSVVPATIPYGFNSQIALQVSVDQDSGISGYAYFYFQNGTNMQVQCPPQYVDHSRLTARCPVADVSKHEPGLYTFHASIILGSGASLNATSATLLVTKQDPTILLTPTASSSLFGDEVSFTTQITTSGNGWLPSGNFTLFRNDTLQSVIVLNGTFESPEIPVGQFTYSLIYSGDNRYTSQQTALTHTVGDNIIFRILENPVDYGVGLGYTLRCSSPFIQHLTFFSVAGNSPHYKVLCEEVRGSFVVPSFGIGNWTVQLSWPGDGVHPPIVKTLEHQVIRARTKVRVTPPDLDEVVGNYTNTLVELLPNQLLGDLATASGSAVVVIDGVRVFDHLVQNDGRMDFSTHISAWNRSLDHVMTVTYPGDSFYNPVNQTFFFPKEKVPAPNPFKDDLPESEEDVPFSLKGAASSLAMYHIWTFVVILVFLALV